VIVTVTTTTQNNLVTAEVTTEVSSIEQQLMDVHGEPQIDIHGTFPYTKLNSDSDTFVIATTQLKYVRSGMPVSFALSLNTDTEAAGKVAGWGAEIVTRIGTVMDALKALPAVVSPSVQHYEV
jgi:hypothetical protein